MKTVHITLQEGKKVYIASDFHLGIPGNQRSVDREKKVVQWLDQISIDAQVVILLGDIFDFWFEYTHLVPKGFVRLQGKLAQMADIGVQFILFKGNHDLWMFDYFEKEIGAIVSRAPILFSIHGRNYFIVHGDGRGPGDNMHKLILKVFESTFFQWLFRMVSPEITYRIATFWSKNSRLSHGADDENFLGEREWLWAYAKEIHKEIGADFYIFGHRHLALDLPVGQNARYINTGQWISDDRYLMISDKQTIFTSFEKNPAKIKVY